MRSAVSDASSLFVGTPVSGQTSIKSTNPELMMSEIGGPHRLGGSLASSFRKASTKAVRNSAIGLFSLSGTPS